ncbi:MAG TPA: ABC transporter ATP-binding protein [Polyangiaceae bacterium]
MTAGSAPALAVCGLTVVRDGRTVVRDVSFDVKAGEVVAIIGPNGAGKSTLLEAVVGLRRPVSGSVAVRGRTVTGLSASAAAFAYMPDEAAMPEETSVRRELGVARGFRGDPLALALGIVPLLDASSGRLSHGEGKRVALYQALRMERPIVALDEPFGAFDPRQLEVMLPIVRARAEAGAAVVLTVHQMTTAERMADRILLLADGNAVAFGTASELQARAGRPNATLEQVFLALLPKVADAS